MRFRYVTPKWNDCVLLGLSEIRSFGARVMPVARRPRAVLLDLAAQRALFDGASRTRTDLKEGKGAPGRGDH
jgi:hypothetical protein